MAQLVIEVTDEGSVAKVLAKLRELGVGGEQAKVKVGGVSTALGGVGVTGVPAIDGVVGKLGALGPAAIAAAAAIGGITIAVKAVTLAAEGLLFLHDRVTEVGSDFQQLRIQLETASGSAERAAESFELIKRFAASTPFEVENLTAAFIKLKGAGIEPTERVLTAFGNVAAAKGRDVTDFADAVRGALTGEMERLKGFDIVARQHGDSITFIYNGMETTVAKTSDAIVDHLVSLGEVEFAGGMARQAASLVGAVSNWNDALSSLYDRIATSSGILAAEEEIYRALARAVSENEDSIVSLAERVAAAMPVIVDFAERGIDLVVASAQVSVEIVTDLADAIEAVHFAANQALGPFDNMAAAVLGLNDAGSKLLLTLATLLRQLPGFEVAVVFAANIAGRASELEAAREVEEAFQATLTKSGEGLADLERRLEAAEAAAKRASKGTGELTAEQKKLAAELARHQERWKQTVEGLRNTAAAQEYLAKVSEDGAEALDRAKDVVEVWTALQAAGAGASQELLDTIKLLTTQAQEWGRQTEENLERERRHVELIKSITAARREQLALFRDNVMDVYGDAEDFPIIPIGDPTPALGGGVDPRVVEETLRKAKEAAGATEAIWNDAAVNVGTAFVDEMAYAFQQIALNGADESEAMANAMIGIFTAAGAAIGGAFAGPMGAAVGGALGGALGSSIFGPSFDYGGSSTISRMQGDLALIGEDFGKTKDVMRAALLDLEDALGGFVTSLGEISIQVHEDGKGVRLMVGREWAGVFDSVSEALTMGLRLALDEAEFSRTVSEFMQAILRGTRAQTLEELQADIDFGKMIESFGLSDLEQEIRGIGFEFDRIFDELVTLLEHNVEQLGAGLGSVIAEEASRWESIYRELMGIEPSPEELRAQVERSARLYEAEKALRIVDLKARAIELTAQRETVLRRARLDELGLRTEAKLEAGRNHLRLAMLQAGFRDLGFRGQLYEAEQNLATQHFGAMGEIVNAAALALEAQLAAINELIAALEAIPPIDFGNLKIPKLGGGGGGAGDDKASDLEQLQRILEDFDLSQLGDYERALAEINRKWAEAAELAHGNAKLLDAVANAREREIEALERERNMALGQRMIDVFTRLEGFGPQSELEQRLADLNAERMAIEEELISLMEEGVVTAEDLARARERLQAGEEAHRAAMEREVRSEADDLMLRLLDAAGRTEEAAELRWRLEIHGYQLAIAEIEAKAELLGITVEALERMRELLGEVEGQGPPQVGTGTGGSIGASSGVTDLQRERERALETLQGFLDLELSPYERDLKRLTETFDELRATLGNTAEVQRAWMLALEDLNDRYTSQIRDYLDTLRDPLLNQVESVDAIQQRFLALAATGDLSQSGELMQLAEQLQAAYLGAYGSAAGEGAGFAGLLDLIEATILGFLGEGSAAGGPAASLPSNVIPFPSAAQREVEVAARVGESNAILSRIEDLLRGVEHNTGAAPSELRELRETMHRGSAREIDELRASRAADDIRSRRFADSLNGARPVKLGRTA